MDNHRSKSHNNGDGGADGPNDDGDAYVPNDGDDGPGANGA
jgi:hypothetical protein